MLRDEKKAVNALLRGNSVIREAYERLPNRLEQDLFEAGLVYIYQRGILDEKEHQLKRFESATKETK